MAERLRTEMTSSLGTHWRFSLYDDSYASSYVSAPMNDFELAYNPSHDWLMSPIITSELSLHIYDDGTTGIDTAVTSIETSDEKNIRITMERDTGSGYEFYWAGIVLKDSIVRMNEPEPTHITIRAVCGITRLKDLEYEEATDGTYTTPQRQIQFVSDCLDYSGLSTHWGVSDDYIRESIDWYYKTFSYTTADSPLYVTRNDARQFVVESETSTSQRKTCYEVLEAIMKLWGARIFLSNGAYYIQQVRNFDGTSHTERQFVKALSSPSSSTVTNRVQTVTSQPTSDKVRVMAGGEFYRLAPLHEVKATVQPTKDIRYVKSGDQLFNDLNDPLNIEYDIGTIRGGSGSGKSLKITLVMWQRNLPNQTASGTNTDITITVTLPTTGSTYYLDQNATTGELSWSTSSADVTLTIPYTAWSSESVPYPHAITLSTPEIPTTTATGCTVDIDLAIDAPGANPGSDYYNWLMEDARIWIITDGEGEKDTEVRIENDTSSDNSLSRKIDELWFNDLSTVSSNDAFECWDGTGWAASTDIEAGFDTDTNLTYTMLYEHMALQRTPITKYRGTIDGYYEPWKYWEYGSLALVFLNGTLSGKMDEWTGEWFDLTANRASVGSSITERDWRNYKDLFKTGDRSDNPKWVHKFIERRRLGEVGVAIDDGDTVTVIDMLNAIGHDNLRDDDTIHVVHPLTLETLDSFTVNGDVTDVDTQIAVTSDTAAEDIPIGSIIMHDIYEMVSSDVTRGKMVRLHGSGYADSAVPNETFYYSTTQGKLAYKDSGGTVRTFW